MTEHELNKKGWMFFTRIGNIKVMDKDIGTSKIYCLLEEGKFTPVLYETVRNMINAQY